MRRSVALAALVPLLPLSLQGCAARHAAAQTSKQPQANQERAVELTVYADDFALVHELRSVRLEAGPQKLRLTEVSKQLDPRSVMLAWDGDAKNLPALVSNSYDLGVDNGSDLLKRYLGQEVDIVRYDQNGNAAETQHGRLMVSSSGQTVLQAKDKFIVNPEGTIIAPARDEIVTIPQLSVSLESPAKQDAKLGLSYLSRGLSWATDYVATVLPSEDRVDLQCWATVTNQTGTSFPAAKVTLMAGEPNRAVRNTQTGRQTRAPVEYQWDAGVAGVTRDGMMIVSNKSRTLSAPTAVGDLQAYAVEKPADIIEGQMNRLMLISSKRLPIKREYKSTLPYLSSVGWGWSPDSSGRGSVQTSFSFMNKKEHGLGIPLPAGILRVYGKDKSGSTRYLGASDVWNAPKDAKVDVTLSNAFDLYTMRKVLKSVKAGKRTTRRTIEVVVHNEKGVPTTVKLVQPFYGKWKVQKESIKHMKLDASNASWNVLVKAGEKKTLQFVVDVS